MRFPFRRREPVILPLNRALVIAAAGRLAAELEPGDFVFSVSVQVISRDQMVLYSLRTGETEVRRAVFGGDTGALQRAAEALGEAFVDATVREGP